MTTFCIFSIIGLVCVNFMIIKKIDVKVPSFSYYYINKLNINMKLFYILKKKKQYIVIILIIEIT